MDNLFGLLPEDIAIIKKECSRFKIVQQVVIFGSRAKGNNKPGSDIDLALMGKEITQAIASELQYILNEETSLPYKFDVVAFQDLKNNELKSPITRIGKPLY